MDNLLRTNIVVLGHQGFGKTCTLASMYDALTRGAAGGFQISVRDFFSPTGRLQRKKLNGIIDEMKNKGKLPDADFDRTIYEFTLEHNYETQMEIDWNDYPGGWVLGDDEKELNQLCDILYGADALVLIIPADNIQSGELYFMAEYGQLMKMYNEKKREEAESLCLDANGLKDLPIIFFVTKSDKYKGSSTYSDSADLRNQLRDLIARSPVVGMNATVFGCCATLGWDLKFIGNDIDPTTYKPFGFEMPILLSVLTTLCRQNKSNYIRNIEILNDKRLNEEIEYSDKEKKFLAKIFGIRKKDRLNHDQILNEIKEQRRNFEHDKKNYENLMYNNMCPVIDACSPVVFINGSEITMDLVGPPGLTKKIIDTLGGVN